MSESSSIVEGIGLGRTYHLGAEEVHALVEVNIQVTPGQFIAIVGRSGSGKTTLLNLLAGLDRPTAGSVLIEGKDLSKMNERELTKIRAHKIGFVFQSFGLLPLLTALENVELPLRISGVRSRERDERSREALEMVGLLSRSSHRPYELSGGEQQRVAIARAVVNKPPLIFADEPTGELDSTNAQSIFGLLVDIANSHKISVIATTHDSTLLTMANQIMELRDGKLTPRVDEGHR